MMTRTYRMYGLVPYNISPIQKGIQFGHAVVKYMAVNYRTDKAFGEACVQWANVDSTFIILNGGTTNNRKLPEAIMKEGEPSLYYKGTLNNHVEWLRYYDIPHATFCEPDLGNQLTAVVFLVDDRIWDKENYPDFKDWLEGKGVDYRSWRKEHPEPKLTGEYEAYEDFLGGETQAKLREWLKQFRFA